MSRYIDADAVISVVDAGHLRNPLELAWSDNDVVDMIESRPTVDAVQVVRCSECVHFEEWTAYEKTSFRFQHDGMCKYWNHHSTNKNGFCDQAVRITDGFCADGERRTDEQQT